MGRENQNKKKYSFLYVIYRRIRFLSYKKKVLKDKTKQLQIEEEIEQKSFQESIRNQQKLERKRLKKSNKEKAKQEKFEKKEIRRKLKEQKRLEQQRQKAQDIIKKKEEAKEAKLKKRKN